MKIGAFTFGGGYAMLALIENECVAKKGWLTHDEFMDITVIAESTPGPVAINTATFVGYKKKGPLGSFFATFGVVLPSFVIIYLISLFLKDFLEITWVASAFKGIRVAVAYLIIAAGLKMWKKLKKTPLNIAVFIAAALAMIAVDFFALRFSTVYMILIAALVALSAYGVGEIRRKEARK
ncbi:MAG: chromate transporter [Clostridia bacterium]|nr:chromate transporter [Clostridia bacterium]